MTKKISIAAFVIGALTVLWMGSIFIRSDLFALLVIALIAAVYLTGFREMLAFQAATDTLSQALQNTSAEVDDLDSWIGKLDDSLKESVKLRIEGEKVGLPAPVLTPYLVGLLVMLGLLGTFAGMVETLKGAVLALEGTNELAAIRAGLKEPIHGLSLAFGTSVAGVATSAMLGLISVLSRKERMQACKILDHKTSTAFRKHSLYFNRHETFKAMQYQAQALPEVAGLLKDLAGKMGSMTDDVSAKLLETQQSLTETVSQSYTSLANNIEKQLSESIAATSKIAGETLEPVVKQTLEGMSQQIHQSIEKTNEQLNEIAKSQLSNFSSQFESSAEGLIQTLQQSDEQRQKIWFDGMNETSSKLDEAYQAALASINNTVSQLDEKANANHQQSIEKMSEILAKSESLVESRMKSEEVWLASQEAKTDKLVEGIAGQLEKLVEVEEQRSEKGYERLASLEASVATHLKDLGASLEEPMARLIETSSEAPRAAAELISQLREEMLKNIERDNALIDERQRSMEALAELSDQLQAASEAQHKTIESLVEQSAETLTQIGTRFTDSLGEEAQKVTTIAEEFAASTVELASLGDAFSAAVELFAQTNKDTLDQLGSLQVSMEQSAERSDEQLAYYVAQAREIIDHSILSQKEMFDTLRSISQLNTVEDDASEESDIEEVA